MPHVKDVMTKAVVVVKPDDTVKHAAIKMEAHDVGPLPVCDGERLVGVLTDRDITLRTVATGRDPNTTSVRETMTAELYYLHEDDEVQEAANVMRQRQVRRLPVVNRDERLVGIVALADLARHAPGDAAEEALEGVSKAPKEVSRAEARRESDAGRH